MSNKQILSLVLGLGMVAILVVVGFWYISLDQEQQQQLVQEKIAPIASISTTPPLTTVIQYCAAADRGIALAIQRANSSWSVVTSCNADGLQQYDRWLLIGGQNSNPIFNQVFGPVLTSADQGFVSIFVDKSHAYGGSNRQVWGVGGWKAEDALGSAYYVAENGLPSQDIRRTVRY